MASLGFPKALTLAVLAGVSLLAGCEVRNPQDAAGRPITPEDTLATMWMPGEMARMLPKGLWVADVPQFNVDLGTAAPGSRYYVVVSYGRLDDPKGDRAETVLTPFDTEAHAVAYFDAAPSTLDKGTTTLDGTAVADQCRYYSHPVDKDSGMYETSVRFRVGHTVGRFSYLTKSGHQSTASLAAWSAPLIGRARELQAGQIKAQLLPANLAAHLPPASIERDIGPISGTAMIPCETWALGTISATPVQERDRLVKGGARQLGFRRYNVRAYPDRVVEVTVLPFEDRAAEAAWFQTFITEAKDKNNHRTLIDAGKTGPMAAYARADDGVYELQFVKGGYAYDILCTAPFGEKSTPPVEGLIRKMAETWYAALPNE